MEVLNNHLAIAKYLFKRHLPSLITTEILDSKRLQCGCIHYQFKFVTPLQARLEVDEFLTNLKLQKLKK